MEAEAIHDFVPTELGELPVKKGDRINLLNYGDDVTWYTAEMGTLTGIVPGNYLQIERPTWYYGRISRAEAEKLLKENVLEGTFLVRLSETSPNDFSMSVRIDDSVQHFRIMKNQANKYWLWDATFSSINQLVDHHRRESVSKTRNIVLRDKEFIVVAIYDFISDEREGPTELSFKQGELITVYDITDEHWWRGRIGEREGYFPSTYVKNYNPAN